MLRLFIFAIVVALIFIRSPERRPEPALAGLAASAATAAGSLPAVSPRTALEAARLAEAARRAAGEGIERARRALAPQARP